MEILNKPTVEERMDAFEEMVEAERQLLLSKGHDYTAGNAEADAYANFRIVSGLLVGAPVTPFTVALVYFMKHVLSVITFARSGKQESNESLKGRFNDIRNYAFILNELVPDHQQYFQEKEFFERPVEEMVSGSISNEVLDKLEKDKSYWRGINPPGELADESYKYPPIIPPPTTEKYEDPAQPVDMIHVFGGWIPLGEIIKRWEREVDAAIEADGKKELDEMLAAANEAFDCATETGDCDGCDISEICAGEYVGTLAPEDICCSQYCEHPCEKEYSCCCFACVPVCPDKVEPTRANSFNYEEWDEWKEKQRKEELKNDPKEEEEEVETGINWPLGC